MKKNIPVFEFLIDDSVESGVKTISIVADPAFQSSAVYFGKNDKKLYQFSDKKKQIVAGLSLIPNVPIYRFDQVENLEYYGYFSAETIEKIVTKYHQEMLGNKVNVDHNDQAYIDAYLYEDYIVNTSERKADLNAKGIDHKNIMGAWYTAFKIQDPKIFAAIEESGSHTGFSVEAYLDKVMSKMRNEVKNKLIDNKVKQEMKKINKSVKEKILSIFMEIMLERALVPELAFEIEWTEVGQPVNKIIVDENGNETLQPVGQGEFNTDMGIIVVDEQSNLVEVRANADANAPEVPASGDTSISGSTNIINDQTTSGDTASGYTTSGSTSGNTSMAVSGETSGATSGSTSGDTALATTGDTVTVPQGINKTVAEVVGTNDGDYIISVCVEGGVVTEANVTSSTDLMLSANNEIAALKAENKILLEKNQLPITEPILTTEVTTVDYSKMNAYERSMAKRGLQPVGVKK